MKNKLMLRMMAEKVNQEIFNSELDISDIQFGFKKKETVSARAWYINTGKSIRIILIKDCHDNKKDIFHSVAHELIHHWQASNDLSVNHNVKHFRYWKAKMSKRYGFKFNKYF